VPQSNGADAHDPSEAGAGRNTHAPLATPNVARTAAKAPVPTILQVVPRLDLGGVERGAIEIADAIVKAGGRALVASAGGRLERRLAAAGGELVRLPMASKKPWVIWRNAAKLTQVATALGVDVIHARSRAPAWSAWLAARRAGVPFVTTYHGVYNEDFPGKRLYNSVMAKGDPVIAISDYVAGIVKERHGVPDERLVVIPRGADTNQFREEAVGEARVVKLASAWGVGDDSRPVLLLPGRLTRWKGQEHAIEAARILKAERGPGAFQLIMVGDDGGSGFEETLFKRMREERVLDCVKLAGRCDDMAAAYLISALVLSTSIEPEAFGRVAVEAQAMGRPVVATAHGGACETVADGESGWLYPPGDARALAEAIGKALDLDPSQRAHMGLAGRARVHSRFTVRQMQQATLAVYERVMGKSFKR